MWPLLQALLVLLRCNQLDTGAAAATTDEPNEMGCLVQNTVHRALHSSGQGSLEKLGAGAHLRADGLARLGRGGEKRQLAGRHERAGSGGSGRRGRKVHAQCRAAAQRDCVVGRAARRQSAEQHDGRKQEREPASCAHRDVCSSTSVVRAESREGCEAARRPVASGGGTRVSLASLATARRRRSQPRQKQQLSCNNSPPRRRRRTCPRPSSTSRTSTISPIGSCRRRSPPRRPAACTSRRSPCCRTSLRIPPATSRRALGRAERCGLCSSKPPYVASVLCAGQALTASQHLAFLPCPDPPPLAALVLLQACLAWIHGGDAQDVHLVLSAAVSLHVRLRGRARRRC
jgi:hypothetical protein